MHFTIAVLKDAAPAADALCSENKFNGNVSRMRTWALFALLLAFTASEEVTPRQARAVMRPTPNALSEHAWGWVMQVKELDAVSADVSLRAAEASKDKAGGVCNRAPCNPPPPLVPHARLPIPPVASVAACAPHTAWGHTWRCGSVFTHSVGHDILTCGGEA